MVHELKDATGAPAVQDAPEPKNGARFDALQFRLRVGIVIAMASAASLSYGGPNGPWVSLYLLFAILPAHFAIRKIVGTPNPTGWLDLLAALGSSGVVLIEPSLFAPAFLFQLLNVSGSVAFLTSRWNKILSAVALVAMAFTVLIRPIDDSSWAMFIVAVVFVPALSLGASQRRDKEFRSVQRVRSIADHLPVLVWEADRRTGLVRTIVGDPHRVFGRGRADLLGRKFRSFVHPDDREAFDRRFLSGDWSPIHYRFQHQRGHWCWVSESLSEVIVGQQKVVRGVMLDVTSERQAHDDVVRQGEIVQRMSAATIVIDQHRDLSEAIILDMADPLGDLVADVDAVVGRRLCDVLPHLVESRWLSDGFRRLGRKSTKGSNGHGTVQTGVHGIVGEDGATVFAELQLFTLPDHTSAIVFENVTEREQAAATVRHQSTHDDLTGLANRTQLHYEIRHRLEQRRPFALAVIDLNDFKAINDALGHSTGDQLLRVIGQRLSNAVGRTDVVARLGGDEFGVVLEGEEPLDRRLDDLVEACRDRVTVTGSGLAVGVSIGVARAPHHADDVETLFRLADIAMYGAKRSSNTVMHYQFSDELAPERLDLMADLSEAFTLGQFVPYFQPKVDLATGEIAGAEILARWEHPTRGVLTPADFIQLVSLSGHLDELMSAMLWSGLTLAQQLPEHVGLSLNLSAVNLRRPDLATVLEDALRTFDIDPNRITIELTENEFTDDTGVLVRALDSLIALGFGVSVDDFGTGFSSLTHLQSLPLTELKIDQRFVRDLDTNSVDVAIVRSLITMGRSLGLTVVAEGVERVEVADVLRDLSCHQAQGYLLGRPLPAADFVNLCMAAAKK